MEENHLEYGYLEGESIGGHFAEDPVGVSAVLWGSLVANVQGAVTFFVCAHVSSASNNNKKNVTLARRARAEATCCSIAVVAVSGARANNGIGELNVAQHAE